MLLKYAPCLRGLLHYNQHLSDQQDAAGMPGSHLVRMPIAMEGSNQMRLRNDDNLKNTLMNIFEGDVGEFFKTEVK